METRVQTVVNPSSKNTSQPSDLVYVKKGNQYKHGNTSTIHGNTSTNMETQVQTWKHEYKHGNTCTNNGNTSTYMAKLAQTVTHCYSTLLELISHC